MKVLHIISGDGGGISTYVKNLIKENENQYYFHVLSFTDFYEEFMNLEEKEKVTLHIMPRPIKSGIRHYLNFMNKFFKHNKFDFIECHIPGIYSLPFKYIASINGSKSFAVHSHQTQLVYGRKMTFSEKIVDRINPLINRRVSDIYISCGKLAAEYAFGTNNYKKTKIIYNSIELDKFLSAKKHSNRDNNKITIGHIGRHSAAKNLPFIINLAEHLKNTSSEYEFEIQMLGYGELTNNLKNEVRKKKLDNIVKIHGRKKIEEHIKTMDVILLPSYSEGLPTVAIEAQAAGIPSICSNTITKEVDLGLGLVAYLPIDNNKTTFQKWESRIKEYKYINKPSTEDIERKLIQQGFDSNSMFIKYNKIISEVLYFKKRNRIS